MINILSLALGGFSFLVYFNYCVSEIDFKTKYLEWQHQGLMDYNVVPGEKPICPQVSEGVFGDWRYHSGCAVDAESPPHRSLWLEDKKKSPMQDSVQLSDKLVRNTLLANEALPKPRIDQTACSNNCLVPPPCCNVQTEIIYPLFGYSITAHEIVEIVQGQDSLTQPVVYRKCMSSKSNIIVGHCEQTQLPRFLFVYPDNKTQRYVQDIVLMPSNCECIADLEVPATTSQSTISTSTPRTTSATKAATKPVLPPSATKPFATVQNRLITEESISTTPSPNSTSEETIMNSTELLATMATTEIQSGVKETRPYEKFLQDLGQDTKTMVPPPTPLQKTRLGSGSSRLKEYQKFLKKLGKDPNTPVTHLQPVFDLD